MKSHTLNSLAFAVAVGMSLVANAQTMSDADLKSGRESVDKTYQESKARCDAMTGNAKTVCMTEATGNQKSSMAEMEARNKPSAASHRKALDARADADYDLAKQKCQDQMGNARGDCMKEAKSAQTTARANAKTQMTTDGSSDGSKATGKAMGNKRENKGEGPK